MALLNKFITTGTDFTRLRYGKDVPGGGSSGQPFIRKNPVSDVADLANTGGIGWFRGGSLITPAREDDLLRFRKWFRTPQGTSFIAKQNMLSRIGVKTQASFGLSYLGGALNEGIYNPLVTKAQIRLAGSGIHLTKNGLTGLNPTSQEGGGSIFSQIISGIANQMTLNPYSGVVTKNQLPVANRLVDLTDKKINPNVFNVSTTLSGIFGGSLFSAYKALAQVVRNYSKFRKGDDPNVLFKYGGGPGSFAGVLPTTIRRYSNTNEGIDFSLYPGFEGKYYVLSPGDASSREVIGSGQFNNEMPSDFRADLLSSAEVKRQLAGTGQRDVLSKSIDYTRFNLESRTKLGNPGIRSKDTLNYNANQPALDKINALELFKSTVPNDEYKDLINLRIAVQDNQTPDEYVWLYFRSFIESMSDSYGAEWDPIRYAGRGEKFWHYQGFNRSVNFNFNVMAQSLGELRKQYRKLNYLASSLAPSYSPNYMQGNIIKLTVGDYFKNQFGIITNLTYNVDMAAGWEIGIGSDFNNPWSNVNENARKLPKKIDVQMQFTPIERFRVEKQVNTYNEKGTGGVVTEYGDQQYIDSDAEPIPSELFTTAQLEAIASSFR